MYVVFAMPRTGSHFLQTGIDQHPDVEGRLELLNPVHDYKVDGQNIREAENPESHVRHLAQYAGSTDKEFGFITHIQASMYRPMIMRALNQSLDVVIRLTRDNILRRIVSLRKAQATQQWRVWEDRDESQESATFEIRERDFAAALNIQDYHSRIHDGISDPVYVEVVYEELTTDYQGTLNRVWEALGLEPVPVEEKLVKQTPEPIEDLVENYDEFVEFAKQYDLDEYLEE